jgi:hypothetical protein
MALEEHEDTDSLLDELEEARRRLETSFSSDTDGISAADMIATALWRCIAQVLACRQRVAGGSRGGVATRTRALGVIRIRTAS